MSTVFPLSSSIGGEKCQLQIVHHYLHQGQHPTIALMKSVRYRVRAAVSITQITDFSSDKHVRKEISPRSKLYTFFSVKQTVDIVQETVFQGCDVLNEAGAHAASAVLSNSALTHMHSSGFLFTLFKCLSFH